MARVYRGGQIGLHAGRVRSEQAEAVIHGGIDHVRVLNGLVRVGIDTHDLCRVGTRGGFIELQPTLAGGSECESGQVLMMTGGTVLLLGSLEQGERPFRGSSDTVWRGGVRSQKYRASQRYQYCSHSGNHITVVRARECLLILPQCASIASELAPVGGRHDFQADRLLPDDANQSLDEARAFHITGSIACPALEAPWQKSKSTAPLARSISQASACQRTTSPLEKPVANGRGSANSDGF